MIAVAIVEDDAGVRRSLEWLLKSASEFSCAAACASAEGAWKVLASLLAQPAGLKNHRFWGLGHFGSGRILFLYAHSSDAHTDRN
jgi:hypothetical protein